MCQFSGLVRKRGHKLAMKIFPPMSEMLGLRGRGAWNVIRASRISFMVLALIGALLFGPHLLEFGNRAETAGKPSAANTTIAGVALRPTRGVSKPPRQHQLTVADRAIRPPPKHRATAVNGGSSDAAAPLGAEVSYDIKWPTADGPPGR